MRVKVSLAHVCMSGTVLSPQHSLHPTQAVAWLSFQICATTPTLGPLAHCPLLPGSGFPFRLKSDQVWEHMPMTPALGLEQEDYLQLKANLSYIVICRSTKATT